MNQDTVAVILAGVSVVIIALLCCFLKKKKVKTSRVVFTALLSISVYAAWFIKFYYEPQVIMQLIPFYKIINISEFGYSAVLTDLLKYALPFLPIGFFCVYTVRNAGLLTAFCAGIMLALVFNIESIIVSEPFVSEEYIYAGIGSATGASFALIINYLFKKKAFLQNISLTTPKKMLFRFALGMAMFVYLGVAFIMIADYGEKYADITFFKSETVLPKDTVNSVLSSGNIADPTVAYVYNQKIESPENLALALKNELMPEATLYTTGSGNFTITGASAIMEYTKDSSWTYSLLDVDDANFSLTVAESDELARAFFQQHNVLSVELNTLDEAVLNAEQNGYDLYYTTMVNNSAIINNNRVTVSVCGKVVTKIDKKGPELEPGEILNIISREEAYNALMRGEGAYTLFEDVSRAEFYSCNIAYMVNNQGYYLPIWCFKAVAITLSGNEVEFEAYVPAYK